VQKRTRNTRACKWPYPPASICPCRHAPSHHTFSTCDLNTMVSGSPVLYYIPIRRWTWTQSLQTGISIWISSDTVTVFFGLFQFNWWLPRALSKYLPLPIDHPWLAQTVYNVVIMWHIILLYIYMRGAWNYMRTYYFVMHRLARNMVAQPNMDACVWKGPARSTIPWNVTPYCDQARLPKAIRSYLPPANVAADRSVSVVFGPWRRGGFRPSSVGGLRLPF
jgi:hypothetical protein